MKKQDETPEQQMWRSIEEAKATCARSTELARNRYKWKIATAEAAAKMLDKWLKNDNTKKMAIGFFGGEGEQRKKEIAKQLMKKSLIVKATIERGSPLYFTGSGVKMGAEEHKIVFYVRPSMRLRHIISYTSRPSEQTILHVAQTYFPKVKQLQIL